MISANFLSGHSLPLLHPFGIVSMIRHTALVRLLQTWLLWSIAPVQKGFTSAWEDWGVSINVKLGKRQRKFSERGWTVSAGSLPLHFQNIVCFFQYAVYFPLTSGQDSCYQRRHFNYLRTPSNTAYQGECFILSLKKIKMAFCSFLCQPRLCA